MNPKYKPVRKVGAYNGNKTKRWDGKKWVPVNVVHRGQKATLNGKAVRADGKGNWVTKGSGTFKDPKPGKKVGTYSSGNKNRKPTKTNKTTKTTTTTKSNNAAAINARLKKQREAKKAALARTRGGSNSQILRPAPAKSKPTKATPTRSTPTRSTPAKPTKTTYSTPSKTQGPLKSKANSRSWLKDNYKPGKGPARRSTAGTAKNKPKQSSRMAAALKNLKVRKYGKK